MKKLLMIGLCIASFAAHADWKHVTDATDGSRMLGNPDTFQFDKNQHGVWVATMKFLFVTDGVYGKPNVVAIDMASCTSGEGEMATETSDGKVTMRWWSKDGTKMYDVQGALLCNMIKALAEQVAKEKAAKAPKGAGV